eukprot:gnl/Spiro4/22131_TR10894_c0_g1_i2.p1 gnl/Spiro4/22131_TR10894_c0_g1~~gnl/Spiro4/22131_TR10894_c0_g1_i2.p1  ORF type:complete len:264 (+),score=36.20 gnl/Spiro4/22131_TR10894_c0_g1_i2:36-794(+)
MKMASVAPDTNETPPPTKEKESQEVNSTTVSERASGSAKEVDSTKSQICSKLRRLYSENTEGCFDLNFLRSRDMVSFCFGFVSNLLNLWQFLDPGLDPVGYTALGLSLFCALDFVVKLVSSKNAPLEMLSTCVYHRLFKRGLGVQPFPKKALLMRYFSFASVLVGCRHLLCSRAVRPQRSHGTYCSHLFVHRHVVSRTQFCTFLTGLFALRRLLEVWRGEAVKGRGRDAQGGHSVLRGRPGVRARISSPNRL